PRGALLLLRVQEALLVAGHGLTPQLGPARDRPDVGDDAPVLAEQLLGLEDPRQAHATAEQPAARGRLPETGVVTRPVAVETLQQGGHVQALRLRRLRE